MTHAAARPAVSVIELIIAFVIIGLIAAITIPQFGHAAGPDPEAQLREQLIALRHAIEAYQIDHGVYPAEHGDGTNGSPAGSSAAFVAQLTRFSDRDGSTSAVRSDQFCFGPYLPAGIPPAPLGHQAGRTGVIVLTDSAIVPRARPDAAEAGWVYNCRTGFIVVNAEGADAEGVRYDGY